MSVIQDLKNMFAPTFKQRLDDAIGEAARLESEATRSRVRADHYTLLVNILDPWKDHWSFAHARDSQLLYQAECVAFEEKAREAHKLVEKLIEQVKA